MPQHIVQEQFGKRALVVIENTKHHRRNSNSNSTSRNIITDLLLFTG